MNYLKLDVSGGLTYFPNSSKKTGVNKIVNAADYLIRINFRADKYSRTLELLIKQNEDSQTDSIKREECTVL